MGPIEHFVRTHQNVFQAVRSVWSWQRRVLRRLRAARYAGAVMRYLAGLCLEVLHNVVWTSNRRLRFQSEGGGRWSGPQDSAASSEASIRCGKFSDLADLTLDHPEKAFPGFREYRKRIKRGDRVYFVRQNGELALVAWTGIDLADEFSQRAASTSSTASKPSLLMYECWPIQRAGNGCARLLGTLSGEASRCNADLLVQCPALPSACVVELERRGFVLRARIVGHKILRWLRHNRVQSWSASDEQSPFEDGTCPKLRR